MSMGGGAAITIRYGHLVVHVKDVARLPIVMESLQMTDPVHSQGRADMEIMDVANHSQRAISQMLGVHCSSLRDATFRLRKQFGKAIPSRLLKKLAQLNGAASLLRHFSSQWGARLLHELSQATSVSGGDTELAPGSTSDDCATSSAPDHPDARDMLGADADDTTSVATLFSGGGKDDACDFDETTAVVDASRSREAPPSVCSCALGGAQLALSEDILEVDLEALEGGRRDPVQDGTAVDFDGKLPGRWRRSKDTVTIDMWRTCSFVTVGLQWTTSVLVGKALAWLFVLIGYVQEAIRNAVVSTLLSFSNQRLKGAVRLLVFFLPPNPQPPLGVCTLGIARG